MADATKSAPDGARSLSINAVGDARSLSNDGTAPVTAIASDAVTGTRSLSINTAPTAAAPVTATASDADTGDASRSLSNDVATVTDTARVTPVTRAAATPVTATASDAVTGARATSSDATAVTTVTTAARSLSNDVAPAYKLGSFAFTSRLIVGSGKYSSLETQLEATRASGAEMVTVALRRVPMAELRASASDAGASDASAPAGASSAAPPASGAGVLGALPPGIRVLPNTAGCFTAAEAVTTAQLGRELLGHNLVKLEVIGDARTLFPDTAATLDAARTLVAEGFEVLPYIGDDPVACQRLEALGCVAVMPLAAPIGSGLGIRNPANLRIILETVRVPVVVDAGVGTASDAALAMELGATALLMNSGIAGARDPVKMARAMRAAVAAGRDAYEAGRIPRRLYATASSPMDGLAEF